MAMATSTILLALLLVSLFQDSRSIILCDEGCKGSPGASDLGICQKDTNPDKTPIFLMGLFPCNVPDFRARGLTVAGQMAVRAVRLDTSILQDYRLELSFSNSMCSRIDGVRAFIDQIRDDSMIRHMIIGPGCSTGAVTIAETVPFYNLTQISYTAASITLSDKRRFPTFFRTISSDNASIAIVGAFLQEFRWEQMAIITLRNELFNNLTNVMRDSFTSLGVNVITEGLSFNTDAPSSVFEDIIQQLNVSGARIVLFNTFEDSGRQLLCNAYRRDMMYPEYLFLTYYWWSEGWVLDPLSNCTVDEIVAVTNRSIALDYYPEPLASEMDAPTDVGSTPNEFWTNFLSNISALNYPANEALRQAGFVYDAVWTAAFALDEADRRLKAGELEGRSSLLDFSYSEDGINRLIFNATMNARFKGVTGAVSFNEFGDREPTGEIFQFIFPGGVEYTENSTIPKFPNFQPFAVVNKDNTGLEFVNNHSRLTVFPGGVPLATEELLVSLGLFIVMTILSFLGVVFAIVCIIFNLVFREKRLVKLTSPFLNVVTIIGAIVFYVDVILFGIDENIASFSTVDALCQTRIWLSSIGFSLFFGPILAKSFRVYYIFRSVKLKKKPIKDWALLIMVAIMVGIDVLFLIPVSLNMFRLTLSDTLFPREGGQVPLMVNNCSSEAARYWVPILLAYKAVYLLVGLLLAAQTYSVKIKELRDSKLIVVSVFATFVISVVLTVIGVFVVDNPDAFYALLAVFILGLITGVLGLLTLPRMVELYRNPSGDVQLATASSNAVRTPSNDQLSSEDSAKIAQLRKTVASLRAEIDEIKNKRSAKRDLSESATALNKSVDVKGSTDELLSPSTSSAKSLGAGGEEQLKRRKKGSVAEKMEMSGDSRASEEKEFEQSPTAKEVETET